jgi:hypothetical protein
VAHDDDHMGLEVPDRVLDAAHRPRIDDVAGHAHHEQAAHPWSYTISVGTRESEQPRTTANGVCDRIWARRSLADISGRRAAPPKKRALPVFRGTNRLGGVSGDGVAQARDLFHGGALLDGLGKRAVRVRRRCHRLRALAAWLRRRGRLGRRMFVRGRSNGRAAREKRQQGRGGRNGSRVQRGAAGAAPAAIRNSWSSW